MRDADRTPTGLPSWAPSSQRPDNPPALAPPGAGLPGVELRVARLLFAWRRWRGTRASFQADFDRERHRIAETLARHNPDAFGRQVLIRRPPGLEDSSRNWSVWMTLDHLRIVHREFVRVIGDMSRGVVPDGTASTAAVKPDPTVGPGVRSEYEASCKVLSEQVESIPDLNTRIRYPHPWFGPLSAAGWHALAGTHMKIHRVQIDRILAVADRPMPT